MMKDDLSIPGASQNSSFILHPSSFRFSGILNGLHQLRAHKVRSTLTILGIVLGVAATMTVISLIQGMFVNWITWFTAEGGMEKFYGERIAPPSEQAHLASLSPGFTLRDALAIQESCPLAAAVSPEADFHSPSIQRKGKTAHCWLMQGIARGNMSVGNYEIARGRFISDLDVERYAPVAILGAQVVRDLFAENEDPLGQKITINGLPFTVVGLFKHASFIREGWKVKENKSFLVSIPITAMQKRMTGNPRLTWLNAKVANPDDLDTVVRQVENTLSFSHRGIRDFRFNTHEGLMKETSAVENSYSFTLGGIAGVSLLVGGIGIMNVMLASMHERIREIGLRKAVGGRSRDIFIQFLGEAITLAVLGGIMGVAVGAGLISFLQTSAILADTAPPILSAKAALIAFGFSVVVGILSGAYPAVRAARLDPIEALRYE